ncbi:hypothetical protein QBC47DRAFT_304870 [Echria macrotheca]|uniref:F-box domain-containing protein n=1 Tax=Echria macrotheca TaxID=438768 RepID=A0AAJ0F736_9PEZI|nr:hypothetical protein QBC47DRAFT_304870 [Echria macrotheca]
MYTDNSQATTNANSRLLMLPVELRLQVLDHLTPRDLLSASWTCRLLYVDVNTDLIWRRLVEEHIPYRPTHSRPFPTYRELFESLDPFWFLAKYKIWVGDSGFVGRITITCFNQRTGCIEGYQPVARDKVPSYQRMEKWGPNNDIWITKFNPKVQLHLDDPILRISSGPRRVPLFPQFASGQTYKRRWPGFRNEVTMEGLQQLGNLRSSFIFTKPVTKAADGTPQTDKDVWPPPRIPSDEHVLEFYNLKNTAVLPNLPQTRAESSPKAFGIRKWFEAAGIASSPTSFPGIPGERYAAPPRIQSGGILTTYSTLDPKVYTPTATKPYRGIWVGDYSAHGCEFLLVHQPDDVHETPAALVRGEDESDEQFEQRKTEAAVPRNRLEAIKLTGDPNIPQGQVSFVADDIGDKGFLRVEQQSPFAGVRVVRSTGHIAQEAFRNESWMESELFLVSHDLLAHHWVEFKHINYFRRVNLDALCDPATWSTW